jgi:hypothetical protein
MWAHNVETLGRRRAVELRSLRERIASQMTPEIAESLARPYHEITTTVDLRTRRA